MLFISFLYNQGESLTDDENDSENTEASLVNVLELDKLSEFTNVGSNRLKVEIRIIAGSTSTPRFSAFLLSLIRHGRPESK